MKTNNNLLVAAFAVMVPTCNPGDQPIIEYFITAFFNTLENKLYFIGKIITSGTK